MLTIVTVILPVFLLILIGYGMRRLQFPGEGFWSPAERLVYWAMFPALIVTTLASADFTQLKAWPIVLVTDVAILVVSAISFLVKRWYRIDNRAFTSVFQGATRMNTYIGFSIAFGVFGKEGLAAAAIAVTAIVPLVNILGVLVLTKYGDTRAAKRRSVGGEVVRNPLIIACVIGGALNLTGTGSPPFVGPLLEILARAALPLGLLAVGAALSLEALRNAGKVAATTSILKLLVSPGTGLLLIWGLGLEGVEAFVAVLFAGLPTATSAYILARQLGGDAPLMANLVTTQTLLAILTLPLVLALV